MVSGQVPRELVPGVVWGEEAEARFAALVAEMAPRFGEKAAQEARWVVEGELHRRFVRDRVIEAGRCRTPQAKRDLVARWRDLYGVERADRLVGVVRSDRLSAVAVENW